MFSLSLVAQVSEAQGQVPQKHFVLTGGSETWGWAILLVFLELQ